MKFELYIFYFFTFLFSFNCKHKNYKIEPPLTFQDSILNSFEKYPKDTSIENAYLCVFNDIFSNISNKISNKIKSNLKKIILIGGKYLYNLKEDTTNLIIFLNKHKINVNSFQIKRINLNEIILKQLIKNEIIIIEQCTTRRQFFIKNYLDIDSNKYNVLGNFYLDEIYTNKNTDSLIFNIGITFGSAKLTEYGKKNLFIKNNLEDDDLFILNTNDSCGFYYLLIKKNNHWKIVKKIMTWVT